VLHPAAFDAAAKPNAMSCVLRVEDAAGASALLSGDIGAAQEASLVAAPGRALKSDLLLVPHHGSRTSSSDAFVSAVAPRVAIVQAGYRKRYGHPAPEAIGRYARRGVEIVDSVPCGAWTWRDGAGVCERDLRRRYWHHAGSASRRLFEGARD
jgi:competence protein ComEC